MNRRARVRRWLLVVTFAIGMAWVEAATVYDLRVLLDRVNPYQTNPLPLAGILGQVELVREAATLLMLFTLGALAGRTWRSRLGYSAIAFGVWDLFYYLFLKVISGWPASLFDWDVLFLLPVPWWGPVLAPICIAVLMIVWGTAATGRATAAGKSSVTSTVWICSGVGQAIALYLFMADALHTLPQGIDAMRAVLPHEFNWPLFIVALVLMAAPIAAVRRPSVRASRRPMRWFGRPVFLHQAQVFRTGARKDAGQTRGIE